MSITKNIYDHVKSLDDNSASAYVSTELTNLTTGFFDLTDWSKGVATDDNQVQSYVGIDFGGEYSSAVYLHQTAQELLDELQTAWNDFDSLSKGLVSSQGLKNFLESANNQSISAFRDSSEQGSIVVISFGGR